MAPFSIREQIRDTDRHDTASSGSIVQQHWSCHQGNGQEKTRRLQVGGFE
jgi:hypothetical protein